MAREIKVTFPGGKRVDAEIDGHVIRTDQPVKDGGEDTAAAPFALFLASLAACMGFYALQFCQSRKIGTEGLALHVAAERDEEQKRYSMIRAELTLPAGFPEKYRDAILRAMDTCAVKKHMHNPPEFSVSVK